ncbi:putative bifunctional diguanylate cyclase/phosphodiesterase [Duganella sp. PWIR1]
MYEGLGDKAINWITAIGALVSLACGCILLISQIYPVSMYADLGAGLLLTAVYLLRKKIPARKRLALIVLIGMVVGVIAIVQSPVAADGLMVLAAVMTVSFTNWSGVRSLIFPVLCLLSLVGIAIAVSMGVLIFDNQEIINLNTGELWLISAMTLALLGTTLGGSIHDLKTKLFKKLNELEVVNAKLFNVAYTDSVTGLANRQSLALKVDEHLAAGGQGVLLVIDVIKFRLFNALNGNIAGDKLLCDLSAVLKRLCNGCFIARLPGAQFAAWMPNATEPRVQQFFADLQDDAHHQPSSEVRSVRFAAAFARAPLNGDDCHELVKNVDVALTIARKAPPGPALEFTPDMASQIRSYNLLKQTVHQAMENGGFYPVYQTKINPRTGQVHGAEGLARMKSVDGDTPPGPAQFIPIVHEEGWMMSFGATMLRAIINDIPLLVQALGQDTKISANVSPPLFLAPHFLEEVQTALSVAQVDPRHLVIEITEEVFAADLAQIVAVTGELRSLGVGISLDDFGAGFSSLSYLRLVTFDEIKIDRSFIKDIATDEVSLLLFRSMCQLGRDLGSVVVAEGVEDEAQLAKVCEHGCDLVQGFYYSRPLPLDSLQAARESASATS